MPRPVRSILRLAALLGAIAGVLLIPGCSESGSERDGPPIVLVDIAPMRGIVSGIVRDGVEVRTLVPSSVSPHGFALKPSDARLIREATQIVQVGAGLSPEIERAIRSIARPDRVVTFASVVGIDAGDHGHAHDHDHADHAHGPDDPHLWLDPALVIELLERLPDAMDPSIVDPERVSAMIERVRAFDTQARERLDPVRGARIVTLHHGFDRFCERYGIVIADTVRDYAHGTPSPADMARLALMLKNDPVDRVFVEPQFPDALAVKLASDSGVPVSTLDPLGDGDWLAMMDALTDELARMKDEIDD